MDVAWHNFSLIDATDATLTAAGAALLANDLADERLVVLTLLGSPSTQRERVRFVAQLLHVSDNALAANTPRSNSSSSESSATLVASVTYVEDDYCVLVLDVNAVPDTPAWRLVGALCALSSVVVTCLDDSNSSTSSSSDDWLSGASVTNTNSADWTPPALLLPLASLLTSLLRDHAATDVDELTPQMLTLDFSSSAASLALSAPSINSSVQTTNDSSQQDAVAQLLARKHVGRATRTAALYAAATTTTANNPFAFILQLCTLRVKCMFTVDLTGSILQQLVQFLTHDATNLDPNDPLDLSAAWDAVVERACSAVAADALSTYSDCLSAAAREQPPLERTAFETLHTELERLALDVFHNGTRLFAASSASAACKRSVRHTLKASIESTRVREIAVLDTNSKLFCETVGASLWQEIVATIANDDKSTFAQVQTALATFDTMYCKNARGSARDAVLCAFYRDDARAAFAQLEARVTQRVSDAHLQSRRDALEAEFATQKELLVAHFAQQEAQLRASVAREHAALHKMHDARNARVRIDESANKHAREQLEEVARCNSELESRNAALEQMLVDSDAQRAALAQTVRSLEHSVQLELTSRAELVETLAATIQSAEAKERVLATTIDDLQHELGEKTFRVETELHEQALQLRKTSEEKDELQKKLNEFFLKVTALPAALQQQLFCANDDAFDSNSDINSEPPVVHFADALAGFMSH